MNGWLNTNLEDILKLIIRMVSLMAVLCTASHAIAAIVDYEPKMDGLFIFGNPSTGVSGYISFDLEGDEMLYENRPRGIYSDAAQLGATYGAIENLTPLTFDAVFIGDVTTANGSGGPYPNTNLQSRALIDVPLPTALPLLLSAFLGTAFFGRKRSKATA